MQKNIENKDERKKNNLSEKYQALVDNKTIYGLINSEELNENNIFKFCGNVLNRKTAFYIGYDTILLKKVDTLFSQKDKDFISKQYKNSIHFILDEKLLKHKKVIEYDTTMLATREKSRKYYTKLLEKYHCIGFVDMPLFNLKKEFGNCSSWLQLWTYVCRRRNLYLQIE